METAQAPGSEFDHSKFGLVCHRSRELASGPLAPASTAGGTRQRLGGHFVLVDAGGTALVVYEW